MTITHSPPSVEGPYATYNLPVTSVLGAATMVNLKTSPTDRQQHKQSNGIWNGSQYRKEQAYEQQREQHQYMNSQK